MAGESGLWALECIIYWNWNFVYACELYSLRMILDRGSGGLGCFSCLLVMHNCPGGELGEDEQGSVDPIFCKK
jgi:hypothetical protein